MGALIDCILSVFEVEIHLYGYTFNLGAMYVFSWLVGLAGVLIAYWTRG